MTGQQQEISELVAMIEELLANVGEFRFDDPAEDVALVRRAEAVVARYTPAAARTS